MQPPDVNAPISGPQHLMAPSLGRSDVADAGCCLQAADAWACLGLKSCDVAG